MLNTTIESGAQETRGCRLRFSTRGLQTLVMVTAVVWVGSSPGLAQTPSDGLALGGTCPASYLLEGVPMKGDPKLQVVHQGAIYHMSSAEAKEKFQADPEKYLPQYGGWCACALGGFGNRIQSDAAVYEILNGKVFLFSSERAKNAFLADPSRFIGNCDQRFGQPELSGYCPVAYAKSGKVARGDAKHASVFHGFRYHFVDAESKATFDRDPAAVVPYDIFCATAAADDRLEEANALTFSVVDGRSYFFANADAKKKFDADPAGKISSADANWPSLMNPRKLDRKDRYDQRPTP